MVPASTTLRIYKNEGIKTSVYLDAFSAKLIHAYLEVIVTVCGKEHVMVKTIGRDQTYHHFDLDADEKTISKSTYASWFYVTGSDNAICEELILYEILTGASCHLTPTNEQNSILQLSPNNIVINPILPV